MYCANTTPTKRLITRPSRHRPIYPMPCLSCCIPLFVCSRAQRRVWAGEPKPLFSKLAILLIQTKRSPLCRVPYQRPFSRPNGIKPAMEKTCATAIWTVCANKGDLIWDCCCILNNNCRLRNLFCWRTIFLINWRAPTNSARKSCPVLRKRPFEHLGSLNYRAIKPCGSGICCTLKLLKWLYVANAPFLGVHESALYG